MRGATMLEGTAVLWEEFQSTRPMRGATTDTELAYYVNQISIHAPHAGRDLRHADARFCLQSRYFNPRAPCGARRDSFLKSKGYLCISIHAPHAGRDHCLR